MKRLTFELTLKPFKDPSDEGIRTVCREILRQWAALGRDAESFSFLLWTADGSEILDYAGSPHDRIDWARWIGIANGPWKKDPQVLHTWRWPYLADPHEITYERLGFIVRTLKDETRRLTGKPVSVGATFDPGPEFAESSFKYSRHPEISRGDTMGEGKWTVCGSRLHADRRRYAGFPDGVPESTPLGVFLGRQSRHFLRDLGFDYLWFSNGFAFALAAWSVTGEVFDGKRFDTGEAPRVRDAILEFWQSFRQECPDFPLETRGSNLSTGMDLAAHASPLREIYRGGFGLTAPVNSPWAALNGDYGLELVGWLSHLAELPDGSGVPYRFYLHDPWWDNSPWLDRYGREPNDIYLPLAVCRLDETGNVTRPASVALLTLDDSRGDMPATVPNEVTPHLQRAMRDFPDAPGLLTWVYPFDEYHDWTFGQPCRVDEVFFGDWFLRAAVNQGLPLSSIISTRNYLRTVAADRRELAETILLCPAPDADTELARALVRHVTEGGKLLLYGPLRRTAPELRALLGLSLDDPISGPLRLRHGLTPDRVREGAFPDEMILRPLVCGGGIEETTPDDNALAEVTDETGRVRAFAQSRELAGGGCLAWVRGALCEEVTPQEMLPQRDDPRKYFAAESLLRLILDRFGCRVRFAKPSVGTRDPIILPARCRNGWFFSGFSPSTNTSVEWCFADGVPVPVGCDVWLENGSGSMSLPRAWHRECRVFVRQEAAGEVSCREQFAGAVDVQRRLLVTGLRDATVTFLHDSEFPSAPVRFQEDFHYIGLGKALDAERVAPGKSVLHRVSGSLLISQTKENLPAHFAPHL